MNKIKWLPAALLVAGLLGGCGNGNNEQPATDATTEQAAIINTTDAYICPMHCEGGSSMQPGKCPVCGMDMVPNPDYKGAAVATPDTTAGAMTEDDKASTPAENPESH